MGDRFVGHRLQRLLQGRQPGARRGALLDLLHRDPQRPRAVAGDGRQALSDHRPGPFDAELRNAPDVTPWRRGWGLPIFLVTGIVLSRTDREPTIRQLYEIAELGKPADEPTRCPQFMRLVVDPPEKSIEPGLDFREEILGRIYDRGDPRPKRKLVYHIEVADDGTNAGVLTVRRVISNWKRIGRIVFDEAVASYNGDFVVHFHHPPWRRNRNDASSVVRRPPQAAKRAR